MDTSYLFTPVTDTDSPVLHREAVTRLLTSWRSGNRQALEALTPLVYQELRTLAHRYMRRERANTLQATAVVHEAFVRMVDMNIAWQDRAHFYAVAASLMRRILVDHAKSKQRDKRGGGNEMLSLEAFDLSNAIPVTPGPYDVLDIDAALDGLSKFDARMAQTVEFYYFGGMSCPEIALLQGLSETTVHRDLRLAKAWMLKEMKAAAGGHA